MSVTPVTNSVLGIKKRECNIRVLYYYYTLFSLHGVENPANKRRSGR